MRMQSFVALRIKKALRISRELIPRTTRTTISGPAFRVQKSYQYFGIRWTSIDYRHHRHHFIYSKTYF